MKPAAGGAADALRGSVRRYYTQRLAEGSSCCGDACGCGAPADDAALGTDAPSFGCGQPTALAELVPGEDVLDLGSGAGLDAFRAAEAVGPAGSVTGVDMTAAMLERARAGAARLGYANVRFVEGVIEDLPLADASVDVVLSNCVVNLSTDKGAVFRQAHRVLRPGGRLAISDILRHGERLTAATEEGWCACVDGAEPAASYRRGLADAGFVDIAVDEPPAGVAPGETYSATVRATRAPVRDADPADLPAIRALLEATGLPTAGLDAEPVRLYVGVHPVDGSLVGVAGFEAHGDAALLRSLAVRQDARGHGWGLALLRHAERAAHLNGARDAYALTTTIAALLDRLGYERTGREALPASVLDSPELRGACPASATVHRRALG